MPLTAASRAWLADALDAAPNDIRIEPMAGATSSSVYAVRTQPGVDAVLRLFDNAAWLADEPDLACMNPRRCARRTRRASRPRLIAWSARTSDLARRRCS
jgi:hypothetical protein